MKNIANKLYMYAVPVILISGLYWVIFQLPEDNSFRNIVYYILPIAIIVVLNIWIFSWMSRKKDSGVNKDA